jgi:DNA adenine methylase
MSVSLLSAAQYFGGKLLLSPWIISNLPKHSYYCEPFGGMANVLLNKERTKHDRYVDLYKPAVNFLQTVRDRPDRLIDEIKIMKEWLEPKSIIFTPPTTENLPIEDAAHFFLYSQLSFSGGGTRWSTGLTTCKANLNADHLYRVSDRLQGVSIQYGDAFDAIEATPKDDSCLIYADPPYFWRSRKSKDNRSKDQESSAPRKQYACELTDDQHRRLAEVLEGRSAIVSGYASDLYSEIFAGWDVVSRRFNGDVEYLWISPVAAKNLQQLSFSF